MGKKINHEVFGEIEYSNGWVKNIQLSIFGEKRNIEVIIDEDEDAEFEKIQIDSYIEFFSNIQKRIDDAENATFIHYQSIVLEYREQFDSEADKNEFAPIITNKKELDSMITPKQIMFPLIFDDKREAGFVCDCSWEIEHGLGIKFENEEVVEVGFQDILL